MARLWQRFSGLPPLAYFALGVSIFGVAAEVTFHFLPASTFPALASWFANLNAPDQVFFSSGYELLAHFCIGLGLAGMLTAVAQMQLKDV